MSSRHHQTILERSKRRAKILWYTGSHLKLLECVDTARGLEFVDDILRPDSCASGNKSPEKRSRLRGGHIYTWCDQKLPVCNGVVSITIGEQHGAVGDKFVFMDDNATCHRTLSKGIQSEGLKNALGRQDAGRNYPDKQEHPHPCTHRGNGNASTAAG
ncbi:hypothetical protein TNCV_2783121 [Trichonephila clavipes]|nr:hypothetical protein TNCV_2783121 [Trichonephila clavipes]